MVEPSSGTFSEEEDLIDASSGSDDDEDTMEGVRVSEYERRRRLLFILGISSLAMLNTERQRHWRDRHTATANVLGDAGQWLD